MMDYTPTYFDPLAVGGTLAPDGASVAFRAGDRPEDLYVYPPKTLLAVNVALATERPLLVAGEPGSGKSTLAENVAKVLGWPYYKEMITSRVQADDLLWTFDALQRLNDANLKDKDLPPDHHYIQPGGLWWAYDPATAQHRGKTAIADEQQRAADPGTPPPAERPDELRDANAAVILLDEIDKADPDVPNDLLEPLDLRKFTVRQTGDRIAADAGRKVLMILTTNGERELPPAFMRRCVSITLDPPTKTWFTDIARSKFGDDPLHDPVATEVIRHRVAAKKLGMRQPSTGEYLDALDVCRNLKVTPESDAWKHVAMSVLWKQETEPDLPDAGELGEALGEEP